MRIDRAGTWRGPANLARYGIYQLSIIHRLHSDFHDRIALRRAALNRQLL